MQYRRRREGAGGGSPRGGIRAKGRRGKSMPYRCKGCGGRRAAFELLPPGGDGLGLPTYWCERCWRRLPDQPLAAWELAREARARQGRREDGGAGSAEGLSR